MARLTVHGRPFMRKAIEEMRPRIVSALHRAMRDAAAGRSPVRTSPVLVLLQGRDVSTLRHGGVTQNRRTFELYLNGILLDTFQEDHQSCGYATGRWFDNYIAERVVRLEKALGIRVVRGRRRS